MITATLIREKAPNMEKKKALTMPIVNYNKSKSDENIQRDNMGGFYL